MPLIAWVVRLDDPSHHCAQSVRQGEKGSQKPPVRSVTVRTSRTWYGWSELTDRAIIFSAVYLLVHGTVKVVLVAALLMNKL